MPPCSEPVVKGDPVVAGAFHGRCGDPAGLKPLAESLDACGERWKCAHALWVVIRRDCDHKFLGSDINACGVGVELRVDGRCRLGLVFAFFAHSIFFL